jgi:hypothetical protein
MSFLSETSDPCSCQLSDTTGLTDTPNGETEMTARYDILPINRRKQPVRGDEKVSGYGVYSKTLLAEGFSVATQRVGIFASEAEAAAFVQAQ